MSDHRREQIGAKQYEIEAKVHDYLAAELRATQALESLIGRDVMVYNEWSGRVITYSLPLEARLCVEPHKPDDLPANWKTQIDKRYGWVNVPLSLCRVVLLVKGRKA